MLGMLQIKAWCYYESRLLGAHHGLISTYALETMVLYIFMVYHKTVDTPLKVVRQLPSTHPSAACIAVAGASEHYDYLVLSSTTCCNA